MPTVNEYGQPIGDPVALDLPRPAPERTVLLGEYCVLEPLDADAHAAGLFEAYAAAPDGSDWTYLSIGPFETAAGYREWAEGAARSRDPLHFAVLDRTTGCPLGTLSLLRQDPGAGSVEVGFVVFSRAMQRTPLSTEAHFLLMRYVFEELGYRRYEWKCDSLNAPSRRAAERLGFSHEGTFRQATVYRGRNRDTDWYSIIDSEWPRIRAGFERWLAPANFAAGGGQLTPLQTR